MSDKFERTKLLADAYALSPSRFRLWTERYPVEDMIFFPTPDNSCGIETVTGSSLDRLGSLWGFTRRVEECDAEFRERIKAYAIKPVPSISSHIHVDAGPTTYVETSAANKAKLEEILGRYRSVHRAFSDKAWDFFLAGTEPSPYHFADDFFKQLDEQKDDDMKKEHLELLDYIEGFADDVVTDVGEDDIFDLIRDELNRGALNLSDAVRRVKQKKAKEQKEADRVHARSKFEEELRATLLNRIRELGPPNGEPVDLTIRVESSRDLLGLPPMTTVEFVDAARKFAPPLGIGFNSGASSAELVITESTYRLLKERDVVNQAYFGSLGEDSIFGKRFRVVPDLPRDEVLAEIPVRTLSMTTDSIRGKTINLGSLSTDVDEKEASEIADALRDSSLAVQVVHKK